MTCGERYKARVRTVNGLTPEDPTGIFPSVWDYAEWKAVADQLSTEAGQRFLDLQKLEEDRSVPTEDRKSRLLEPMANELETAVGNLRAPLTEMWIPDAPHWTPVISNAVAVALKAACLLEESDDAIEAVTGKRPPTPDVPGKPVEPKKDEKFSFGDLGGNLLGLGILVAIGYWIYSDVQKGKQANG